MIARAGRLYLSALRSAASKLRFDLGREATVAVSSLVLIATFLYVFDDFLNVEIATLSSTMRDRFAFYLAVTVLAVVAAATGRCLSDERRARRGLAQTATALGDTRATLLAYRALLYATTIAALHALAWWAVRRWLLSWPVAVNVAAEAGMLLVTAAVAALPRRAVRQAPREDNPTGSSVAKGFLSFSAPVTAARPAGILSRWRLRQILVLARPSRVSLLCAMLFFVLVGVSAAASLPPFVGAVAALAGGYLVGLCLCFQMTEDLDYAWFERCLGVTHDDFLSGYERTGAWLAGGAGLVALAAYLAGAGFASEALEPALKAGAVAALPALVAPSLLLQIDGRRVFVTGLTLLIVSLFVATAVVAHWLSLVLVPLLRYFAKTSQAGRFYRA